MHVPMGGKGLVKVAWRVSRSRWSDYHLVGLKQGDDITTACGIPVPPRQNFGRSEPTEEVPVKEMCERCWPRTPEAA